MYYALHDNQTNRLMGTGRNTNSITELGKRYAEYIAIDVDEDEPDDLRIVKILNGEDELNIRSIIEGNEFGILESETAFRHVDDDNW